MIIKTNNLSKRYSSEWVFNNFSYKFQNGIYAITGPNGSGKSTLLQVLWGQLPPTSGQLYYFDNDGEIPMESIHNNLVIVAPYLELIEEFTLFEIIKFHFSFKKIRNSTIDTVLEKLEMSHHKDKPIYQFSSGMKQRLKLGLAFYSDVKLYFFDEPTTNLDSKAINWFWENFEQISSDSIVFIGSNQESDYPITAKKLNLFALSGYLS